MKNDPLLEALRRLPEVRASDGFRDAVLERLDERPPRRRLVSAAALLAATLAALVVGLWLGTTPPNGEPSQQEARLQALESERQRVAAELAEVRDLLARSQSREIVLGGNDQVEVVLDVGWAAVEGKTLAGGVSRVVPASYRPSASSDL